MHTRTLLALAIGASLAGPALHAQSAPADDRPASLDAVVVTGSNIKTTDTEGPSPVQVISSQQIVASGKTNLPDVLRSISANSGNSFNEQYTGSFSAGTASVSLRGLGSKNTLVLVDGKRIANYATANELQDTFADLNSLPLTAVDRIEVLKDGASSVYGSDAIAGVVNIILKQNYQGAEIGAGYGQSTEGTGQGERTFHAQVGHGDLKKDRYNVYFAIDGQQRDRLQQDDVSWMRDSDFRNKQSGTLAWAPTNYYDNKANNRFANAVGPVSLQPYGAISPGKTGDVWAYNPAPYNTLMPKVERYHSVLRGTFQLTDNVQAFGEWIYSRNTTSFTFGPPLSIASGLRAWNDATQSLSNIDSTLPIGNPANPNNRATPVTTNLWQLGPRNKRDRQIFDRILFGFRGQVAGWDWEASALHSESRLSERVTNFGNRYAFQSLLANGGYNLASDTNPESAVDALRLATLRPAVSKLDSVDLTASRSLFDLPAGTVGFAAGAQFRREAIDSQTSDAVLSGTELRPALDIIKGSRHVTAGYAEFNVPLLTTLEANVAGRMDHYSDFGNAFAPKFSLRWQPLEWLLVRGSFSRGFRAPSLPEITNSTAVSYSSVIDPFDPITKGGLHSVTNIYSANPNLKPERSKNYNVGFVVAPTPDTSIGVDYFHIVQNGLIVPDNLTYIVAHPEIYGSRIVRDSIGQLLTVYNQYQNQQGRTTSGVDIDASHTLRTDGYGSFTLATQWSRLLEFRGSQVAGDPRVNGAGTNIFGALPKWRGTTSLRWAISDFDSTVTWYHTGGYRQNPDNYPANRVFPKKVGAWNTVDLSIAYRGIPKTTLTLAAQNVLNRRPPWDPANTYYDASLTNPSGRIV
ncbi:MAG: Colicin I receptor [Luteibacter sp.]|uniref:TonB-dependent receptor plug domain-containing protein n=1 Tax=Luteibacter sp. TaxID=1886636 RepID=UPI0013804B0E|nr:TonB-dependent receptor [Luteibacter sp.]KAF1004793.1 MAG: Colicin I receptor [Luteibacter sp.]